MSKQVYRSNGFEVEYESNCEEALEAVKNAIIRGLKACGERARDYARELVPKRTGNLKDHINYEVDESDESVSVGVEHMTPPYGIYVEFGTGKYAETGGRMTKWSYKTASGQWVTTEGTQPKPFIRPAAENHTDEYRQILKDSLENA